MSTHTPPIVGVCPFCGAEISRTDVIIEYEREIDDQAVYAECPDCLDVVNPG